MVLLLLLLFEHDLIDEIELALLVVLLSGAHLLAGLMGSLQEGLICKGQHLLSSVCIPSEVRAVGIGADIVSDREIVALLANRGVRAKLGHGLLLRLRSVCGQLDLGLLCQVVLCWGVYAVQLIDAV